MNMNHIKHVLYQVHVAQQQTVYILFKLNRDSKTSLCILSISEHPFCTLDNLGYLDRNNMLGYLKDPLQWLEKMITPPPPSTIDQGYSLYHAEILLSDAKRDE